MGKKPQASDAASVEEQLKAVQARLQQFQTEAASAQREAEELRAAIAERIAADARGGQPYADQQHETDRAKRFALEARIEKAQAAAGVLAEVEIPRLEREQRYAETGQIVAELLDLNRRGAEAGERVASAWGRFVEGLKVLGGLAAEHDRIVSYRLRDVFRAEHPGHKIESRDVQNATGDAAFFSVNLAKLRAFVDDEIRFHLDDTDKLRALSTAAFVRQEPIAPEPWEPPTTPQEPSEAGRITQTFPPCVPLTVGEHIHVEGGAPTLQRSGCQTFKPAPIAGNALDSCHE